MAEQQQAVQNGVIQGAIGLVFKVAFAGRERQAQNHVAALERVHGQQVGFYGLKLRLVLKVGTQPEKPAVCVANFGVRHGLAVQAFAAQHYGAGCCCWLGCLHFSLHFRRWVAVWVNY